MYPMGIPHCSTGVAGCFPFIFTGKQKNDNGSPRCGQLRKVRFYANPADETIKMLLFLIPSAGAMGLIGLE